MGVSALGVFFWVFFWYFQFMVMILSVLAVVGPSCQPALR